MNVSDAIAARRSVRGFLDTPVDPALLRDIAVKAARAASGGNIQPWHIDLVTGVINGELIRGLVDRTFIDDGVRWIIDFKTSEHEGGNLAAFLDEQQRRYSDQMERYAKILAALGIPVKVGLYFPLLDEWREWSP